MATEVQNADSPHMPENRLGIDYRNVPASPLTGPRIDAHSHIYNGTQADLFRQAADLYGITHVMSMTPIDEAPALRERFGDWLSFIAVPNWKKMEPTEASRAQWAADISEFRQTYGARLCKFWMAPPMRQRHGWTLDHEFLRPLIDHSLELGYQILVHVGDPSVWFAEGKVYADANVFGSKRDQYPQLEWLCEYAAPRTVIAAHMGGNVEDPAFLTAMLSRHKNLMLDSSATKWIVREVARRPDAVRELIETHADRILFGSDIVASKNFTRFDQFASRYWAHRTVWESDYRGESPIEDPDADTPPRLAGLALSVETLEKMYWRNAVRLGLVTA